MSKAAARATARPRISTAELVRLASFRMLLRQFDSFSTQASAKLGLTSVQYQALLAIATQQGDAPLTVKRLAQQLMIKHNSAVGLVDRIEQLGLALRKQSESDRRSVVVALTARGRSVVQRLAAGHRHALQAIAPEMSSYMRQFTKPIVDAAPPTTPEARPSRSTPKPRR